MCSKNVCILTKNACETLRHPFIVWEPYNGIYGRWHWMVRNFDLKNFVCKLTLKNKYEKQRNSVHEKIDSFY